MSIDNIKVGDYARSYDGYIARCKRFYSYDNFIHFDRDIIDTHFEPTNYFDKKDIKKYIKVVSPNIMDLVEEYDYIKLDGWGNKKLWRVVKAPYGRLMIEDDGWNELEDFEDEKIIGIITHEQMETMEYKIES